MKLLLPKLKEKFIALALNTIFVPISMSSAVEDPQGFGPLNREVAFKKCALKNA